MSEEPQGPEVILVHGPLSPTTRGQSKAKAQSGCWGLDCELLPSSEQKEGRRENWTEERREERKQGQREKGRGGQRGHKAKDR